jgi:LmbE family N-acetylglucosaminyl deacetylase
MGPMLREAGVDFDFDFSELPDDFGTPDEKVTTYVDVRPYVDRKRKALAAHASQADNIFFLRLPDELLPEVLGTEAFVRVKSDVPVPDNEDDLFAGIR